MLEINTQRHIKFLIVESNKARQVEFAKQLEAYHFNDFMFVGDTAHAMEIIENEPMIDLVILTANVSPVAKLCFCAKIRQDEKFFHLRVMLWTLPEDHELTKPVLQYAAINLLCEPINQYNLMSWLKQHGEDKTILREMQSYREKMQSELNQARQMQNMILPKSEVIAQVEERYNLKISSYFETCDITGGDFWGVEPISRDNIGFYIVDCTGHGVTAALNTFRMHAVMNDIDDIEIRLNPDLYLSYLNKKLCALFSPGQFATMFYGVIDVKSNLLSYAAAASPTPFLIREDCKVLEKLSAEGFLIGAQKNVTYDAHQVAFNKGDKLLLYSDALIENIDRKGEMYGEGRLVNSAGKHPECRDGVTVLARIIDSFSEYRDGPLADDLTINIYTRV